jgi:hypothetical protein
VELRAGDVKGGQHLLRGPDDAHRLAAAGDGEEERRRGDGAPGSPRRRDRQECLSYTELG